MTLDIMGAYLQNDTCCDYFYKQMSAYLIHMFYQASVTLHNMNQSCSFQFGGGWIVDKSQLRYYIRPDTI